MWTLDQMWLQKSSSKHESSGLFRSRMRKEGGCRIKKKGSSAKENIADWRTATTLFSWKPNKFLYLGWGAGNSVWHWDQYKTKNSGDHLYAFQLRTGTELSSPVQKFSPFAGSSSKPTECPPHLSLFFILIDPVGSRWIKDKYNLKFKLQFK